MTIEFKITTPFQSIKDAILSGDQARFTVDEVDKNQVVWTDPFFPTFKTFFTFCAGAIKAITPAGYFYYITESGRCTYSGAYRGLLSQNMMPKIQAQFTGKEIVYSLLKESSLTLFEYILLQTRYYNAKCDLGIKVSERHPMCFKHIAETLNVKQAVIDYIEDNKHKLKAVGYDAITTGYQTLNDKPIKDVINDNWEGILNGLTIKVVEATGKGEYTIDKDNITVKADDLIITITTTAHHENRGSGNYYKYALHKYKEFPL